MFRTITRLNAKSLLSASVASALAFLAFAASADAQNQNFVIDDQDHRSRFYIQPPDDYCQPQPRLGFYGEFCPYNGMRVLDVQPYSIADRIGLEPGDVIVEINGQRIRSFHHYQQLLRDAVRYEYGRAHLLVKNVRPYPPYVHVTAYLDTNPGYGAAAIRN